MKITPIACALSLITLAACGSDTSQFEKMEKDADDLLTVARAAADPAEIPETVDAKYEGFAGYWEKLEDHDEDDDNVQVGGRYEEETPIAISRVSLDANLADNVITGRLHDFRTSDNKAIAGELAITDGARDKGAFGADVGGTLALGGEEATLAGSMDGQFRGATGEIILGSIDLTADDDVEVPTEIFGIFIVER